MAEMLELSDWEVKITMITMQKSLVEKVDYMQEQMGHWNREMKPLRENQKKMLEIKYTIIDMTNALKVSLID